MSIKNAIIKLEDIGFYSLNDNRAKNIDLYSDLQRCELILTDRCNFSCPYCRGSNQYTKGTLTFEEAKFVVDLWADNNLKNIRFSGGEPTLMDYLVDLVSYTKSKGVSRIAISTNGFASKELYGKLFSAGVNDFSISLDACCSSTGDKMSGVKNSWEVIVDNIKFLSSLTYVTVGLVLTDENFDELADTIEFATSLGVSDIRIISSAQWNNEDKFKNLFDNKDILTKYPILNYRINNFKNGKNVRGIGENDCNKCYLMLDDMVIANNYHFPCVISMREGHEPVGSIKGKTIQEIRKERLEWLKSHNTHLQVTCRNNCLDVCKFFNYKVDKLNKKIQAYL